MNKLFVFVLGQLSLLPGHGQANYSVSKTGKIKTIQAAADLAHPGDTITVHAGIYRERVDLQRGGVVYKAAKGEKVDIRGSEIISHWKKQPDSIWKAAVPNSLFQSNHSGKNAGNHYFNPFADPIHGDWYDGKGWEQHTGAVYLNGHWLMEDTWPQPFCIYANQKGSTWSSLRCRQFVW